MTIIVRRILLPLTLTRSVREGGVVSYLSLSLSLLRAGLRDGLRRCPATCTNPCPYPDPNPCPKPCPKPNPNSVLPLTCLPHSVTSLSHFSRDPLPFSTFGPLSHTRTHTHTHTHLIIINCTSSFYIIYVL